MRDDEIGHALHNAAWLEVLNETTFGHGANIVA